MSLSEFSNSDDSICNGGRPALDELLTKYNIERQIYLDFRSRLEQTKLRSYCHDEDYHIFIVDGWLDNIWGYLYCKRNLTVDEPQLYVCQEYSIQIVEVLGDNWYRFGGS